ncbi:unnamed protein product [Clonostachys rosea f. rosea IK726]|uniref:Uncharacterized protein n=2 Tax=Bionectria ochroleuca TaxID=29856 RepID=A0A0B7K817_BIOOC|nr:unnamed protein product [Clonostachys rosea f. rosea IK726]
MPDIVNASPIRDSQCETEEGPDMTESRFRVFEQLRNQASGATQAQNQSANAGAVQSACLFFQNNLGKRIPRSMPNTFRRFWVVRDPRRKAEFVSNSC